MLKFITPEFKALTKSIHHLFTINNFSFSAFNFSICLVEMIKNVRQILQAQHHSHHSKYVMYSLFVSLRNSLTLAHNSKSRPRTRPRESHLISIYKSRVSYFSSERSSKKSLKFRDLALIRFPPLRKRSSLCIVQMKVFGRQCLSVNDAMNNMVVNRVLNPMFFSIIAAAPSVQHPMRFCNYTGVL